MNLYLPIKYLSWYPLSILTGDFGIGQISANTQNIKNMGGLLSNLLGCDNKTRYYNDCQPVYTKDCSGRVKQVSKDKDQFVKKLEVGFEEIDDKFKKHYSSIRTIEVKAGEKVCFDLEGTFRGRQRITGEGFSLQENFGDHYQRTLNLSDVAHINRIRKDGKDIYYIGIYHGFKGKLNIRTKSGGGEISTEDKAPEVKKEEESDTPESKETNPGNSKSPTNTQPQTPLEQVLSINNELIKANIEIQKSIPGTTDKDVQKRRSNLTVELNKIQAELITFITKPKIDPASLDYTAAKLKYALLKTNLSSDSINNAIAELRKTAKDLRAEQSTPSGKIEFKFVHEDGTLASNATYEVSTSKEEVKVVGKNGSTVLKFKSDKKDDIDGIAGDTEQQQNLLDKMLGVTDWETFDKALKEHIDKYSEGYRKKGDSNRGQALIFEYKPK